MGLSSKVVAVTVYREGALVTRKAEVKAFNSLLKDGKDRRVALTLGPVPLCIDDSSFKVWSDSKAAPHFSSYNVCLDLASTEETSLKELEDELKNASTRLANLTAKKDILASSLSAIECSLSLYDRGEGKEGEPPAKISFDVRKSLVHFKTDQKSRIVAAIGSCGREIVDQNKVKTDIEDRIKRASKARASREEELSKIVVIQADAKGLEPADSFTVSISYYVPGARWVPSYALSFSDDYSSVDLAMKASLAQNTKEDWTGVSIALSTASYMGYSELPELKSMRIGHSQPPPPSVGWRPLPGGLDGLYENYDSGYGTVSVKSKNHVRSEPALLSKEFFADTIADTEGYGDDLKSKERDCFVGSACPPPECEEPAPCVTRSPSPKAKRARKMTKKRSLETERSAPRLSMAAMSTGGYGGASAPAPGGRGECPSSPLPTSPDDHLDVSQGLLDYGNLEMSGPESSSRGKLVPSDLLSRYIGSPEDRKALEGVDFVKAIKTSLRTARGILRLPLPSNSSIPFPYNDFVYLYEGDALVDIPSDGAFHTVSVLSVKTNTRLQYVSVPRMTEDVFRVAIFDNPLPIPLPEGPSDVSVGSKFLLRSTFDTVAPNGNVELGLGVEQAIKITRNTSYTENEEGIIRSEFNLRHRVDVEIRNGLPHDVQIQVRERIPYVPDRVDNVVVYLEEIDPPWEDYKQEASPITGGHVWNVNVEASKKKKLMASYNVEIPSSYELVGGNRREL